jgi:aldose 1-epimerase
MADVVLGFDTLEGYTKQRNAFLGASVGRFANRIKSGKFTLNGQPYQIPVENGANALHGGPKGFDKYVWESRQVPEGVEFTHVSPDGDMGFPGTLTATVRFTVAGDTLRIDYSASTDRETVVNLTNHSYFNLRGDDKDDVLADRIEIDADQFTPVDKGLIPIGDVSPVQGTPLDLRKPQPIGARINAENEQLSFAQGYDFNYVLNDKSSGLHLAAIVSDPVSGRVLTVKTTEPGLQFYSGNTLHGTLTGRHGIPYKEHSAFCLETQHFPDSPNHPNFPSSALNPGKEMHSTTTLSFSTLK